jgi:hypothetical protein
MITLSLNLFYFSAFMTEIYMLKNIVEYVLSEIDTLETIIVHSDADHLHKELLIDGDILYYISPLPEWSSFNVTTLDYVLSISIINKTDVTLQRTYNESEADFVITWVKEHGLEYTDKEYRRGIVTIGLGDSNCGIWNHYDDYHIRVTTHHKIAHMFGYEHSKDPSDAMFEEHRAYYKQPKMINLSSVTDSQVTKSYTCSGPYMSSHIVSDICGSTDEGYAIMILNDFNDSIITSCLIEQDWEGRTGNRGVFSIKEPEYDKTIYWRTPWVHK